MHVDATVLLFTLGVTGAGGAALRLDPGAAGVRADSWRSHSATGIADRARDPGSARARGALVVAEITLALMLLVGAGLLLKSFARLRDVNPGFQAARVSTFSVTLVVR